MSVPASCETNAPEPGLYWWRRQNGAGWEWTVIQLDFRRGKTVIHFRGTNRQELVGQLEDTDPSLGPRAELPHARC